MDRPPIACSAGGRRATGRDADSGQPVGVPGGSDESTGVKRGCSVKTSEIPRLVSELWEMSKLYLEQEALAPLRRTARFAGYSLLGGVLFAIGWILMTIALFRLVSDLLPDEILWSALAYIIGAAAALVMGFTIIKIASRSKATP